MLNILLPRTLPIATSVCLRKAAIIDVASSGSEVPIGVYEKVMPLDLLPTPLLKEPQFLDMRGAWKIVQERSS